MRGAGEMIVRGVMGPTGLAPLIEHQIRACQHWAEPTPLKTKRVGSSDLIAQHGEIKARRAAQART